MAEVKFLQLSPGWQKKPLKMHQIDALKYGILKMFLRGSMPPDPPRGVISFSPFSPLTRFHVYNTPTHTHTHTHTQTLTHTLTNSLSHTHKLPSLTHTHKLTLSHTHT